MTRASTPPPITGHVGSNLLKVNSSQVNSLNGEIAESHIIEKINLLNLSFFNDFIIFFKLSLKNIGNFVWMQQF